RTIRTRVPLSVSFIEQDRIDSPCDPLFGEQETLLGRDIDTAYGLYPTSFRVQFGFRNRYQDALTRGVVWNQIDVFVRRIRCRVLRPWNLLRDYLKRRLWRMRHANGNRFSFTLILR